MKDVSIKEFFQNHYFGTKVGFSLASGKSRQRISNLIAENKYRVKFDNRRCIVYRPEQKILEADLIEAVQYSDGRRQSLTCEQMADLYARRKEELK